MRIDGAKGAPTRTVDLTEFFDRPTHVTIRIMSPFGRALIREIAMETFEVGEVDSKGRTADIRTNPKGQADREMRTRATKLSHSFAGTDMTADGQPVVWGKDLWDALDETDPRILDAVVAEIDRFSKLVEPEGEANPT